MGTFSECFTLFIHLSGKRGLLKERKFIYRKQCLAGLLFKRYFRNIFSSSYLFAFILLCKLLTAERDNFLEGLGLHFEKSKHACKAVKS